MVNMEVWQKITIWRKAVLKNTVSEEEVIDALNSGDPYTDVLWTNEWVIDDYFDIETEEQIGIDENDGQSTIELINDNGDIIWQNGV